MWQSLNESNELRFSNLSQSAMLIKHQGVTGTTEVVREDYADNGSIHQAANSWSSNAKLCTNICFFHKRYFSKNSKDWFDTRLNINERWKKNSCWKHMSQAFRHRAGAHRRKSWEDILQLHVECSFMSWRAFWTWACSKHGHGGHLCDLYKQLL